MTKISLVCLDYKFVLENTQVDIYIILKAYAIVGVQAGDCFEIKHNGKRHLCTVYENFHAVPCRSFGFKEINKYTLQRLIDYYTLMFANDILVRSLKAEFR